MLFGDLAQRLARWWYEPRLRAPLYLLLPVAWLYGGLAGLRRSAYRCGWLRAYRLPVPVIVVGNLTVGGSGKTPLVLWLVQRLLASGWRPGIVSRGYGGNSAQVQAVAPDSPSALVGDEPLLLARRSGVPVFIGRDRVAASQALLAAHADCDVIVADDGLQHYRLQRSIELVVFDERAQGNRRLLPAGPLREPLRRLRQATAVVWNGGPPEVLPQAAQALPNFAMKLVGERFFAVSGEPRSCTAANWSGRRIYALAGIGNPQRFFQHLAALGLQVDARAFADHHPYSAADLLFARDGVLLMTEKDAVKCAAYVSGEAWVLPVEAVISGVSQHADLFETILERLHGRSSA